MGIALAFNGEEAPPMSATVQSFDPREAPPPEDEGGFNALVNYEVEALLLSALLANNRGYEAVLEVLQPDHFADPANGRIFEAIGKLIDGGRIADAVSLRGLFLGERALGEIGGAEYLASLSIGGIPSQARHYAERIVDLWKRRQIERAAHDALGRLHGSVMEESADDIRDALDSRLLALAGAGQRGEGLVTIAAAAQASLDRIEADMKILAAGGRIGVPSGLKALDAKLVMEPGDLIFLAGRPSMGKTALAIWMARKMAADAVAEGLREERPPRRVSFSSLEMSKEKLSERILAADSGIDSDLIRKRKLDDGQFECLMAAKRELEGLPLDIDDEPGVTVSRLAARLLPIGRRVGVHAVFVDYLQLMNVPRGEREERHDLTVGAITKGLKALAMRLGCPVICLSQLSRKCEERENKRPQLSDLRDSGNIEQDADSVIFPFREAYYLQREAPVQKSGEAFEKFRERHNAYLTRLVEIDDMVEIIIGKQRNGAIGIARARFDEKTQAFGDRNNEPPPQEELVF